MCEPIVSVERAMAADARRGHAVKKIATIFHRIKKVQWVTDAEKVTRFLFGQDTIHPRNRRTHIFFFKGATDTETIKV